MKIGKRKQEKILATGCSTAQLSWKMESCCYASALVSYTQTIQECKLPVHEFKSSVAYAHKKTRQRKKKVDE